MASDDASPAPRWLARVEEHLRTQFAAPSSLRELAALAAGFYDQSHFSHQFKQHTGFTPAEFRAAQGVSFKANHVHDR